MPLERYHCNVKQTVRPWSIILIVAGLLLPGSILAKPNLENRLQDPLLAQQGTPVTSMPGASEIQAWAPIDTLNVLVQIAEEGIFRLTFTEACYNLRWADNIGLSGSQNQVWAGFDYLTADGQRCSIGSINRLADTL